MVEILLHFDTLFHILFNVYQQHPFFLIFGGKGLIFSIGINLHSKHLTSNLLYFRPMPRLFSQRQSQFPADSLHLLLNALSLDV
jgi:hypothetical protein